MAFLWSKAQNADQTLVVHCLLHQSVDFVSTECSALCYWHCKRVHRCPGSRPCWWTWRSSGHQAGLLLRGPFWTTTQWQLTFMSLLSERLLLPRKNPSGSVKEVQTTLKHLQVFKAILCAYIMFVHIYVWWKQKVGTSMDSNLFWNELLSTCFPVFLSFII